MRRLVEDLSGYLHEDVIGKGGNVDPQRFSQDFLDLLLGFVFGHLVFVVLGPLSDLLELLLNGRGLGLDGLLDAANLHPLECRELFRCEFMEEVVADECDFVVDLMSSCGTDFAIICVPKVGEMKAGRRPSTVQFLQSGGEYLLASLGRSVSTFCGRPVFEKGWLGVSRLFIFTMNI